LGEEAPSAILRAVMAMGASTAKVASAEAERSFRTAVFILFALTVLRLLWIASGSTDLYPDEAQYWIWSLKPAWGYYSKPPLIAWLIAAGTWLAGSDNELAVRLAAPLCHFGTALMVYAIAQRLYDVRTAFWSSIAYATLPGVWASAFIISTDAPLLFCWSVALYAFVRAREPGGERWWWAVGVAAGIGLLAKYAMAYWLLSALLFLLIFREERRHLGRFVGAAVLALLVYFPNFLWNYANGFVSYHHTEANAALRGSLIHPGKFFEFFGSQFGVFGPVFFATLVLCAVFLRRTFGNRREAVLAIFAMPTLAMMLVVSFLSRAEPNWAAPTYVSAVILVVAVLLSAGWSRLVWGSVALHVTLVVALGALKPASQALGYDLPAKYDVLHRLHGWRILGTSISKLLLTNPGVHLMADDRELMAALIYYVVPHPLDALKWNAMGGIHDQFDLEAHPDRYIGADFLLVSFRENNDDIIARFQSAASIERITIPLGGGQARTYEVRLLHGFKGYR
jgi:4-amino-4-deoxy-L-arabinose transferase-like glycosyltransferase